MHSDRDTTWADLLRAANAGDRRAYAQFLREVAPVIRGIVRARGRGLGPEACEDVVQEVMLALHAKRHTWRDSAPVQPWLYAIVRYKVADAFRVRARFAPVPIEDVQDHLAAPQAADSNDARDAMRMIEALQGRSADVVRAITIEGASIAEAGSRFAMTPGAVRVALHRGLKRLAALRGKMIE